MSHGSSLASAAPSSKISYHSQDHLSSPDPDDDDEHYLATLIQKSTAALAAQDAERKARSRADFEENEDLVRLDGANTDKGKGKAVQLSVVTVDDSSSSQPPPKSTALPSAADEHLARLEKGELIDNRKSSAKQRRDARSQTAGSGWFDLPAVPVADKSTKKPGASDKANWDSRQPTAQQMRQEITAIRLRNANDPKRFYKGSNGIRATDMPKFAQLGRIIGSNLEPASSLTRGERGRNVVEELVRDAEATAYAKRKFDELQDRKASYRKGGHNNKANSRKKARR